LKADFTGTSSSCGEELKAADGKQYLQVSKSRVECCYIFFKIRCSPL